MSNRSNHRPYSLDPYNPDWPTWFKERAKKIAPLFGDNLISIEHVGSTSIPGMVAKPNIDMLVVVKNLDIIPTQYQTFIDVGYTPQGREYVGDGDEYITEDTEDGRRITSIHVLEVGHPKIRKYREFREYLKVNEKDRQRYIDLKQRLFAEHSDNYKGYDHGKTETIEAIKKRAVTWAKDHLPE